MAPIINRKPSWQPEVEKEKASRELSSLEALFVFNSAVCWGLLLDSLLFF
jgi:hypothetical protein